MVAQKSATVQRPVTIVTNCGWDRRGLPTKAFVIRSQHRPIGRWNDERIRSEGYNVYILHVRVHLPYMYTCMQELVKSFFRHGQTFSVAI